MGCVCSNHYYNVINLGSLSQNKDPIHYNHCWYVSIKDITHYFRKIYEWLLKSRHYFNLGFVSKCISHNECWPSNSPTQCIAKGRPPTQRACSESRSRPFHAQIRYLCSAVREVSCLRSLHVWRNIYDPLFDYPMCTSQQKRISLILKVPKLRVKFKKYFKKYLYK